MQSGGQETQYRDQFGTGWSAFGVRTATSSFGYRTVLRADVDGSEVVVLVNRDDEDDVYHLIEYDAPVGESGR